MGGASDNIRLDPEWPRGPGFPWLDAQALVRGDGYFREALEALPAAVYITDPAGRITYYNEAAATLWGHHPELGKSEWCGSWKLFWPDGRPLPHGDCPMALAVTERRQIRGVEVVAERPDGSRVPFIPYPTPLFDASGTFVGAVNMLVDITERKRAEEQQNVLVAEMKHRVKNTLASVQAIAVQTMRRAPGEELDAFTARLQALAKAHNLLSLKSWHRAPLHDVVGTALGAFQEAHRERFVIEGPEDIWLDANRSLLLAMALHELATNAVKYGALSNGIGRVHVAWKVLKGDASKRDGTIRLNLHWREFGGPPVRPPAHKGFGSRLIERALQASLGTTRLEFDPQGLACTLDIPL
jgi:PAS domain S-box-containing protein